MTAGVLNRLPRSFSIVGSCIIVLLATVDAHAEPIRYTEDECPGDLQGFPPTVYPFGVGVNTFSGTLFSSPESSDFDPIIFPRWTPKTGH